ncbi:hypothetical protein D3C76_1077150 [compost metagenome]
MPVAIGAQQQEVFLQQAFGQVVFPAENHQADALDIGLHFSDQAALAPSLFDVVHQDLLRLKGFAAAHGQARKHDGAKERHMLIILAQMIQRRMAVLHGQRAIAQKPLDSARQCLPDRQQAPVLLCRGLWQEAAQVLHAGLRLIQARVHHQGAGVEHHQLRRVQLQAGGQVCVPVEQARQIALGQQPVRVEAGHVIGRYIRAIGTEGKVDGIFDEPCRTQPSTGAQPQSIELGEIVAVAALQCLRHGRQHAKPFFATVQWLEKRLREQQPAHGRLVIKFFPQLGAQAFAESGQVRQPPQQTALFGTQV